MSTESPHDDADGSPTNPHSRPLDELPRVPAYLDVPSDAVDRALERYEHYLETHPEGDAGVDILEGFIFDEVNQHAVITVDGQPLLEYAAEADGDENAEMG